jgi:hypothetical protein
MHTDDVLDDVMLGVYDQANENDGCPTMHDSMHAPAEAGLGNEAKHELDVLTGRALESAHEAKSAAFACVLAALMLARILRAGIFSILTHQVNRRVRL